MRVAKIVVHNILGVQELEFEPGALTVIEGRNAEGKTSIIEAIRSISGGHDASLIRKGEEFGEVVLVLEDGTEIRKRIGEDRSSPTVKGPDGVKKGQPQNRIDALVDALSFNPVSFITAPAEKRAQWLLELLPLELNEDRLKEIAGELQPSDRGRTALDTIDRLRKRLYDQRTGENRLAKDRERTIATLRASMPEATQNVAEELASARNAISSIQAQRDETLQAVTATMDAELEKIRDWVSQSIQAIKDKQLADEQEARKKASKEAREFEESVRPEEDALQRSIATLEEQQRQTARAQETRQAIERFSIEQQVSEENASALTAAMEGLDKLKEDLLTSLPIRGLEVRDGQVLKDGIPFERVNRAKQVAVALQIAKLRAKDVPLVCVDNLECLDAETFAAFEQAAVNSGLQLVVTRVTEGPLTIQTKGA